MKNKIVKLALSSVVAASAMFPVFQEYSYAAPAYFEEQSFEQPSGERFSATQYGDEWFNWAATKKGEVLIQDEKGYWTYAKLESGKLKSTGKKYKIDKKPKSVISHEELVKEVKKSNLIEKKKKQLEREARDYFQKQIEDGAELQLPEESEREISGSTPKHSKEKQRDVNHEDGQALDLASHKDVPLPSEEDLHRMLGEQQVNLADADEQKEENSSAALTGSKKLLVLLVEFPNAQMRYSNQDWSNRFFSDAEGTVKHYFREVSNQKMIVEPSAESEGTMNDGIVKVRLNYNHPNTGGNTGYANQKLVVDALAAANASVNFASYDVNGDKRVDTADGFYLVTVVAGYEASYGGQTPSVWGHQWVAPDSMLDGVRVSGRYVQQGEIHGDHQATIGILVHELGHHFGLPDLYDTDGTSSGVGIHSVMAGGSWASYGTNYAGSSPTHPDAWSKVKMGWVNPTVISSEQMSYLTLNAIPNQYNVVKVTTDNPYEYFLMENRQFNGYDRGLQKSVTGSGGIAVWHIDESMTTNADERHKLVDLLESNEGRLGYSQLDRKVSSNYNHYYYSGHETMVNSSTKPNTYQYNGAKSGVGAMVYNSGNAMGIYAFKDKTAPTAPSNLRTSAVAANSVSLQWTSSTDNVALWYYAIYRNGQYLAGSYNPSYVDNSVTAGSTYTYTIYAMDYSGNFSPASNTITVTPR